MTTKPMSESTQSTPSKPVVARRFLVLAGIMAFGLIVLIARMIYLASVNDDLRQQRNDIIEERAKITQPASDKYQH